VGFAVGFPHQVGSLSHPVLVFGVD
jgi:hypothetical protein